MDRECSAPLAVMENDDFIDTVAVEASTPHVDTSCEPGTPASDIDFQIMQTFNSNDMLGVDGFERWLFDESTSGQSTAEVIVEEPMDEIENIASPMDNIW